MSAKPTKLPEFASDGTQVIEPPAGLKATGWLSGSQANPGYWNWVANNTYQWVEYLNDLTRGTVWEEHWRTSGANNASGSTNLPEGWTSVVVNSSQGKLTDPSSTFPYRSIELFLPSAAGIASYTLTPNYVHYVSDATRLTWECPIRTSSSFTGAPNYDIGLQFSHSGAGDYFCRFSAVAGAGNWRCKSIGSTTIDTDSGIAVAISTTHTLRMELEGGTYTGTPGQFQVQFYIDDVLVATNTFTTPGADEIRPYFKSANTVSGNGDDGLLVGRVRMVITDN